MRALFASSHVTSKLLALIVSYWDPTGAILIKEMTAIPEKSAVSRHAVIVPGLIATRGKNCPLADRQSSGRPGAPA